MSGIKVPVSQKALMQRINRRLAEDGWVVRTSRSSRAVFDLGQHYVLDPSINNIIETHVDLEAFGHELGALRAWEALVE